MSCKYGLLFKRAFDMEVVGLVPFDDFGDYNLSGSRRLWHKKDLLLFESRLRELAHPELLREKYKVNFPYTIIRDIILKDELMEIAKLINSNEFIISRRELIAFPVALSKELATDEFPFYEQRHQYNTGWTYAFLNDKRFNFKGYKTLGHDSMFSCDEDILDVVDVEEFIKIDDRLPLFIGTMCGRFPNFKEIPGFFNGDKYMGVIAKSLLSGGVGGLTVYFVPKTTVSVDRCSNEGLHRIGYYN